MATSLLPSTWPVIDYQVEGRTIIVRLDDPQGIRTVAHTFEREPDDEDVKQAISAALSRAVLPMSVGERSWTRRHRTPFGEGYTHVMLGPPTWWRPRFHWDRRPEEPGWQVMIGWLRAGVAVAWRPDRPTPPDNPFAAWAVNQVLAAAALLRGGRAS